MIKEDIHAWVSQALESAGATKTAFTVEHPYELSHGDFATNAALIVAKKEGKNPVEFATLVAQKLQDSKPEYIRTIEVAGPGFINFRLSESFFHTSLGTILKERLQYGRSNYFHNQKTIIEFTDPNPFKEFHIGHLMSNTIGEAIARITEANGAEVKRACYQGDVGLHVAKTVAEKLYSHRNWETIQNLQDSYVEGSVLFTENEEFKKFVLEINKKVYEKSDAEVNTAYDFGRKLSLDYFDTLYKRLGTQFDYFFFESAVAEFGKNIVRGHPDLFVESDGAVVYHAEQYDPKLHTRVFINKEGIPTYEAKELGLAKIKYDTYQYEQSVVITGNEINDYFKVLLSALSHIYPDLASKTKHMSHGMLRLPSGKMSSRTGKVITAESIIAEVKEKIEEKLNASDRHIEDKDMLSDQVAVAALKYSILKQTTGKDIVFDMDTSISFEGDSGPYLQYTRARCHSLVTKAKEIGIEPKVLETKPNLLDALLYRYPEVVLRSGNEFAPSFLATYLIELAGAFNSYYGNTIIVNSEDTESSQKVAYADAVGTILESGLTLLGISVPHRM